MDWFTTKHSCMEPKLATRDIPVQIIVDNPNEFIIQTPVYGEVYELGVTSYSDIASILDTCGNMTINGIVSYDRKLTIYRDKNGYIRMLEQSLHATEATNLSTTKIMECVIPKGAFYYKNKSGEYASNKLTPIRLREIPTMVATDLSFIQVIKDGLKDWWKDTKEMWRKFWNKQ